MNLGMCCYKDCTNHATTTGFIYGHFKDSADKKDKMIDLVTCDKHANEKDFYPYDKQKPYSFLNFIEKDNEK
ncbi:MULTISPECIES: hypothetical protein [Bacillus cereus group]|uniref:Uncharacterized protein n=1 Tax=Bacillus thuringiensis TaxID=1428 RepID=A0A9X6ZQR4_BACTU|nr:MULTISPECIES: hypothetical protein [Bacillus cereus group]PFJ33142.1 hypothetical protein COJ15_28275 [Bacillus thuringiensis]PGP14515.1 hypothetical protein COA01_29570 [Bacillus cereus]